MVDGINLFGPIQLAIQTYQVEMSPEAATSPSPAPSSTAGGVDSTHAGTSNSSTPTPPAALQQTTSAVSSQIFSKRVTPRSCYACNQKKIRCDKREPCTACKRVGRPCEYPPVGPRIRRPKKTIIAEMSSRIADLEKSLATQAREGTADQTVPSIYTAPASVRATNNQNEASQIKESVQPSAASNRSRPDIIVQKGSSSQYFNEIILSRAIKEVRTLKT